MRFSRSRLAVASLVCLAGACIISPITWAASPAADLLIVNGRIYTQNPKQTWVEAIAIRDGKIEALGSTEQLQSRRGANTQLLDLGGKMAMPGINEAHSHPVWGGLKHLFQCNFPFTVTPDILADTLKACVARSETLWIQGGQWDSDFFKTHKIDSPRKWLDAVSGDKALVLTDDTGHNAWANILLADAVNLSKVKNMLAVFARDSDCSGNMGIQAFLFVQVVVRPYNSLAGVGIFQTRNPKLVGLPDGIPRCFQILIIRPVRHKRADVAIGLD